jgi:hypothetical protein
MAPSKLPPKCTYNVSSQLTDGYFVLGGKTGMANYFQNGQPIHRGLTFLKTVRTKQGVTYYVCPETEPQPDGKTRIWLFELGKTDGQYCAVYFYYDGVEPIAFGDALYREIRPFGPDEVTWNL